MERWKKTDVKGYEVSNRGRVRSCPRRVKIKRPHRHKDEKLCWCTYYKQFFKYKILRPGINREKNGYEFVFLGGGKRRYVHILVAKAFLPNPNNLPEVNHKDGVSANNHKRNLEWISRIDNEKHAYKNGFKGRSKKTGRFTSGKWG
jgi:hypothetical protein